jgi:hypothetical protein
MNDEGIGLKGEGMKGGWDIFCKEEPKD